MGRESMRPLPAVIDVEIRTRDVVLEGMLALPDTPSGLVVFAHGSGSSRFSRRNRDVAEAMQAAGLGTLLFDLLSAEENARDRMTAEHRFDIALLARRLTDTVDWLGQAAATRALRIGLFGASTGAPEFDIFLRKLLIRLCSGDRNWHYGAMSKGSLVGTSS